jgi:capsular polysaccharide biosynthesis protein
MSNGGNYYALTLSANGASTSAFYSVNPTSNLQIAQGGVTMEPASQATTMVNIYPEELQIQAPPGMVYGGVTIITDAEMISGHVVVSPPVNVAVVVTVYGAGGTQLGQYILDPGVGSGNFSFPSDPAKAMSAGEALSVIQQRTAGN